MKKTLVVMLLLFPVVTMAQEDVMAQMQEVAKCMQSIDKNKIKALENDSTAFQKKIKTLCDDGKRNEAQESAIKFSKKMMNSPVLKSMRKCTEKMPDSMKEMMPNMEPEGVEKDFSNHHVCDEIS